MKIEVIILDRIGNYRPGQVVEIEDGVFLRALLKGGKADVINPPDWSLEAVLTEEQGLSIPDTKVKDHGESNNQSNTTSKAPSNRSSNRGGTRKKSKESVEKTPGNSPQGYGGSSKFLESRKDSGKGESSSSDSFRRSTDPGHSTGNEGSL